MRLNRGELRRDLARARDDLLLELVDLVEPGFCGFFFFVDDGGDDAEGFGDEAAELEVCAAPAHSNSETVSAKYKSLRNPTTSF
jgi:hypothetical protein